MRQLSPLIAREAVRPAAATSSPTCRNIVADVLLATQMASASAASAASPTAALLRERPGGLFARLLRLQEQEERR